MLHEKDRAISPSNTNKKNQKINKIKKKADVNYNNLK